jgi:hypothetical protein
MPDKLARIDPFPPSPEGRRGATKATIDLDAYAPSFNNFTEDRQCLGDYEPGAWDPAVIGTSDAYLGALGGKGMAPQTPGGKKSQDRASY